MRKQTLALAVALVSGCVVSAVQAEDISKALTEGKVLGDFRLRYEQNDTDNNLKTANALTLRSRLGFETAPVAGLSVLVEGSNTSALLDDYAPETTGYNAVPDPTDTVLNRIQLAYSQDALSAVVGRQRIILDNARMVGNVGWRQEEQTYDALKLGYKKDTLTLQYAYINQVHTPAFANVDANNHLLNVAYSGLGLGTVTGYAYLLEDKEAAATAQDKHDTFGARLVGKQKLGDLDALYSAEVAAQQTNDYSTLYLAAEGGVVLSGVTVALGVESLGSDDKKYAFQTPLATKHAFNGWADKFLITPADGLNDAYLKVAGKAAAVNLAAFYHDYSAAKGSTDHGSEINLLASYDFAKYYSVGAKYASYSKGDAGADTNKAWAWIEAKF